MKPRTLIALVVGCSLAPAAARADDVDSLGAKVTELDARIYELNAQLKPPPTPGPEVADRRLIDAQVLYELKNYESASIILMDVVDKYPNSAAYPEATYYLADSLYLKRDFLSSRRFFEKVVELGPQNRRYQEALERLIELSLHTGDYSPVDGYIQKLEGLQTDKQLPSVPYVKGKYFYFRRQFDRAIEALKVIGPTHQYYFHALYFIGASNVAIATLDGKPEKLEDARAAFATVAKADAKDDSQKLIAELSHLALARIYLDQGQLTNSLDEYTKISEKSDLFNDSLYESAWVAIKGKDYAKAQRQLELLMLNAPDTQLAPEVKLLIGSLHIREEQYGPATDSFTKAREEYEPIRKQLADELAKTGSDPGYFRDLIAKNMSKFDIAAVLPSGSVRWVKDEPEVVRTTTLIGDLGDLRKSLDESDEIVRRLEKTLSGPARVNVFPELSQARTKAVEISNELIDVKRTLAAREGELIAPVAGNEKALLTQLDSERAQLEKKLEQLGTKDQSIAERIMKARDAFNELDKRCNELQTQLKGLSSTIDAYIKFEAEGKKTQAPPPAKAPELSPAPPPVVLEGNYATRIQAFDDKINGLRSRLTALKDRSDKIKDDVLAGSASSSELQAQATEAEGLRVGIEGLRKEIEESGITIGVDDSDMQARQQLKAQYDDLLKRQHAVGVEVRARLSAGDRTKAEQIESILDRARGVDTKLGNFNGRIDEILNDRLKDINSSLTDEKAHVIAYRQTLDGYTGESADVGGGIVAQNFKAVADRFYNIVVRADVGIIDVAWALKDQSTRNANRLVAERKREIKLLDDEFKEVLKEQP